MGLPCSGTVPHIHTHANSSAHFPTPTPTDSDTDLHPHAYLQTPIHTLKTDVLFAHQFMDPLFF